MNTIEKCFMLWIILPYLAFTLLVSALYLAREDMMLLSMALALCALSAVILLAIVTDLLKLMWEEGSNPPPKSREPIPEAPQECGAFSCSIHGALCITVVCGGSKWCRMWPWWERVV